MPGDWRATLTGLRLEMPRRCYRPNCRSGGQLPSLALALAVLLGRQGAWARPGMAAPGHRQLYTGHRRRTQPHGHATPPRRELASGQVGPRQRKGAWMERERMKNYVIFIQKSCQHSLHRLCRESARICGLTPGQNIASSAIKPERQQTPHRGQPCVYR